MNYLMPLPLLCIFRRLAVVANRRITLYCHLVTTTAFGAIGTTGTYGVTGTMG